MDSPSLLFLLLCLFPFSRASTLEIVNRTAVTEPFFTNSSLELLQSCVNSRGSNLLDHCQAVKRVQASGNILVQVCCSLYQDLNCYQTQADHFCGSSVKLNTLSASLSLLSVLLENSICARLNFPGKPYGEICKSMDGQLDLSVSQLADPVLDKCARKGAHCKATHLPPTSVDTCCAMYRSMRCMVATLSQAECTNPIGVMYLNAWLNSYRTDYAQGVCQTDFQVTDEMCPDLPVETTSHKPSGAMQVHVPSSTYLLLLFSLATIFL